MGAWCLWAKLFAENKDRNDDMDWGNKKEVQLHPRPKARNVKANRHGTILWTLGYHNLTINCPKRTPRNKHLSFIPKRFTWEMCLKPSVNIYFWKEKKLPSRSVDVSALCLINTVRFKLTNLGSLFVNFPWNAPENRRSSYVAIRRIFLHVLMKSDRDECDLERSQMVATTVLTIGTSFVLLCFVF